MSHQTKKHFVFHCPALKTWEVNPLLNLQELEKEVGVEEHKPPSVCTPQQPSQCLC
eukprot:Gb_28562 [translate_table: standard]